jgi:hypothetical protein
MVRVKLPHVEPRSHLPALFPSVLAVILERGDDAAGRITRDAERSEAEST